MFSKLKFRISHSKLRRQLKGLKRDKRVFNLVTARRVGILTYANSLETFEQTLDFVKFLSNKNLEVCLLAFFPGKEIPQEFAQANVNIFCKKDINWYGKPLIPFAQEFSAMDFDILIDLSMEEVFPIKWISSTSKAKFKVGNLSYYGNPNDLIINVKPSDSLEYLISQIKHYLQLINNRFAQESIDVS